MESGRRNAQLLEAKIKSQLMASKEVGNQSYNHKALNSTNKLNDVLKELEANSSLELPVKSPALPTLLFHLVKHKAVDPEEPQYTHF